MDKNLRRIQKQSILPGENARYSFPYTVMGDGKPLTVWVTMYDQCIPWLEGHDSYEPNRKKVVFSDVYGKNFAKMPKRFIRSLISDILFPLGWTKNFYWSENSSLNQEIRYFQKIDEEKFQEVIVGDGLAKFGEIFIKNHSLGPTH